MDGTRSGIFEEMMDAQHARARSYLALGDSYTIGEGVAATERWPAQLVAALRQRGLSVADPEIIAQTGWTTDELSAAIDSAAPQGPYSLVTLLIGVNNQYRGRDAEDYRGEVAHLLQRAVAFAGHDVRRVIVVSIPDWGVTPFAAGRDRSRIAAEINQYNEVKRAEAERIGARFIDITPLSREGRGEVVSDALHPSGAMYSRWTEAILPGAIEALRAAMTDGGQAILPVMPR